MEAIGLVLGIIPLVMKGFSSYSKASDALSTFKQYPTVVVKLETVVIIQKVIFKNSSNKLDSAINGYTSTVRGDQRSKSQQEIEKSVQESLEACYRSLRQINESLNAITRKLEAFATNPVSPPPVRRIQQPGSLILKISIIFLKICE